MVYQGVRHICFRSWSIRKFKICVHRRTDGEIEMHYGTHTRRSLAVDERTNRTELFLQVLRQRLLQLLLIEMFLHNALPHINEAYRNN